MRDARGIAVVLACVAIAPAARADDAPTPAAARPPPTTTTTTTRRAPRALAAAAAVVPGFAVHGLGHWLAGDDDGARTLLVTEGVGLGAAAAGTLGLFVTGASRKLVAPNILLMVGGAGLFAGSWIADVYGTATGAAYGDEGSSGAPQRVLPAVVSELGYRYVYDPTFAYRSFTVASLDARVGRLHLRPEGWFSPAHANERVRVLAGVRLAGPLPQSLDGKRAPSPARDGSYVDLETAVTRHAFPPERFTMSSIELDVAGRLDLVRVARSLHGAFVEGGAGWGFARHDYAVDGADADFEDQLLARAAFGAYLGRPSPDGVYGEAQVAYEHRHDGYAGGLKMPGLGSGAGGGFAARAFLWLASEVGALVEAQAGSALVLGASVLVKQPMVR